MENLQRDEYKQRHELDLETMTVKVIESQAMHDAGIEDTTVSYKEFYARDFAINHLSHSGAYKHVLTTEEWIRAYMLCDGFGRIDEQTARDQLEFDWSHVRDASYAALVECAEYIASLKWHKGSLDAIIDGLLADAERICKAEGDTDEEKAGLILALAMHK